MYNFFTSISYSTCPKLNHYFKEFLSYEIVDIEEGCYECRLTNSKGDKVRFWNANKPYAWVSQGTINDYSWRDVMPKKSILKLLDEKIKNFNSPENKRFLITEKMIEAYNQQNYVLEEELFKEMLNTGLLK